MGQDLRSILSAKPNRPGLLLCSTIDDHHPTGMVLIAEEYLVAASRFAQVNDEGGRLARPKYMLVCQCLELCLKAYLRNAGMARRKVEGPELRHDLSALLKLCRAQQGVFVEKRHCETIEAIAPAMSMFYFRYGHKTPGTYHAVASVTVPYFEEALDAARALYSVVWIATGLGRPPAPDSHPAVPPVETKSEN